MRPVTTSPRTPSTCSSSPTSPASSARAAATSRGLLAALASDDPSGIVYLSRNDSGSYIVPDAVTPLDDCLASNGVDPANYYDAEFTQGTVESPPTRPFRQTGDVPGRRRAVLAYCLGWMVRS